VVIATRFGLPYGENGDQGGCCPSSFDVAHAHP